MIPQQAIFFCAETNLSCYTGTIVLCWFNVIGSAQNFSISLVLAVSDGQQLVHHPPIHPI